MTLLTFFSWWYGAGWARVPHETRRRVAHVTQLLSLRQVLRTLFAPWKQDVTAASSKAVQDRVNALIGNLISRFVGFSIRSILIIITCVATLGIALYGILLTVVWPILPFTPIVFILLSVL
jgi:hypothetical protein